MSKFKVGDMVTSEKYGIGKIIGIGYGEQSYLVEHDEKNDYLHNGYNFSVKEGKGNGRYGHCYWYDKKDLKPVKPKQFKKADLKDNDKITLKNGDSFYYQNGDFTNYFYDSYDDKLNRIDNLSDREIAKIERATYETIFERQELAPKKMTVSEICKELGYDIEIVKEEE